MKLARRRVQPRTPGLLDEQGQLCDLSALVPDIGQAQLGDTALAHVAGYCVVHGESERGLQLERGGTWDSDTFGSMGSRRVTRDEVRHPRRLGLWLDLNGQRMQAGHTRTTWCLAWHN